MPGFIRSNSRRSRAESLCAVFSAFTISVVFHCVKKEEAPIKLLHLSDLHLGKRVNEFDLIEDQKYILDQIVMICEDKKVDVVLIAGDIYDKSLPPSDAVNLLDHFLTVLVACGIQVFAISGNHDSAERLNFGSRLFETSGLHVAGVFNGKLPKLTLQDEFGPVHIWSLPFVKASTVGHFLPNEDTSTYDLALAAALSTATVNTSERNVILAHQFITAVGKETVPSGSECVSVSVGTVDNVDYTRFDSFDYVALGHIHGAQSIGRETVRYAGSPLKYSLSECKNRKSVPLVTLAKKGDVQIELLPILPLRDMRHISGPIDALLDPRHVESQDDYLWVTLTNEEPILDAMSQVKAVYPNTMKLDYDNRMSATDLASTMAQNIKQKSFEALFCDFYENVTGSTPTEVEWGIVKALHESIKEDEGR